jgi:hypothetical protein
MNTVNVKSLDEEPTLSNTSPSLSPDANTFGVIAVELDAIDAVKPCKLEPFFCNESKVLLPLT